MKPQLNLYVGPMYSGKTARLLLASEKAAHQSKHGIVAYSPQTAGRHQNSEITTRMGYSIEANFAQTGDDILEHFYNTISKNYPDQYVIIVDDAFLIDGAAEVLLRLYQEGHVIHVASIQLSSNGETYQEIQKLMPFATSIEVCSAACSICGEDAHYTILSNSGYEPRCLKHNPSKLSIKA